MNNVPGLETVYRDFAPRNVEFHYIYKQLAHPETNGYVDPIKLSERLAQARIAQQELGSGISWLVDPMDNRFKHAMGNAPNSEFIIDPQGHVVVRRMWSRPDLLREDLNRLVGAPETVTRVEDLDLAPLPHAQQAARGVVQRLILPGAMLPLKTVPDIDSADQEFYVKLRAEAEYALLKGSGALYLGFYPDPIYHVHWNNQADPLWFELKLPDGLTAATTRYRAKPVEVDADADPREFLITVTRSTAEPIQDPIEVTVHYVACDDAQTFCLPVTQSYRVYLKKDRDVGWRAKAGPGVGAEITPK